MKYCRIIHFVADAFNVAWNLAKESISAREYRNMWTNTRPSAGTGRYRIRGRDSRLKTGPMPQDISVKRDPNAFTGLGGISRDSTLSYSQLNPVHISSAMTTEPEGTWGWDKEMIDNMGRVSAHESTHQAIHDIEPSLRHNTMAHEYGAYAGEFAQDEYNPLSRMKHLRTHPDLQNDHIDLFGNRSNNLLRQRAIQDIMNRLPKYKSSEAGAFMGRRARMNALRGDD